MNCKPGDLAMLVRASANLTENLGSLCEVLGASGEPDHEWSIRFFSPKRLLLSGNDTFEVGCECLCPDAWLRPIRDPGDEVVDETLLWTASPADICGLAVPAKEQQR